MKTRQDSQNLRDSHSIRVSICLLLTLSLGLLAGCTTTHTQRDAFRKTDTDYVVNNVVGFGLLSEWQLNPMHEESDQGQAAYGLIVQCLGPNWFFIESGESLQFLIDGRLLKLSGAGSTRERDVTAADMVRERAVYRCTGLDLLEIANGQEVRMRVVGSRAYHDAKLSKKNKRVLLEFAQKTGGGL